MIIFEVIWFLIKAWFTIFIYAGAVVGFLIGLGLAVALISFGWESLTDKIRKKEAPKIENAEGSDPRPGFECMANVDDYEYKPKED